MGTIKGDLAAAERRRASLRNRHIRERQQMIADHRSELAMLDAEILDLRRLAVAKGEIARMAPVRPAAINAGPRAMNTIREMFAAGPMTQAAVRHESGLNVGTVSYSIRALLELGEITETRRKVVNRSREFRLTARGKAALSQRAGVAA